jgi:hypothetical protein
MIINSVSFTTPYSYPDGTYNNGIATINGQKRRILSQIGNTFNLANSFNGSQTGTLSLTKVCSLNFASCQAFGNSDNFGGFPALPIYNIMGQAGLFGDPTITPG